MEVIHENEDSRERGKAHKWDTRTCSCVIVVGSTVVTLAVHGAMVVLVLRATTGRTQHEWLSVLAFSAAVLLASTGLGVTGACCPHRH